MAVRFASPLAVAFVLTVLRVTFADSGLVFDGKPADSGMDETVLAKIDERMREFAREKQIAGAVTLVARRGRVVHLGVAGKADITTGRDMTRDTLFAIASMTKPVTAVAVMILQDEGKLMLDDPLSKYIPEFKSTTLREGKTPAREISIRDCLTHMSGLMSDQRNTGTIAKTAEDLAKTELINEPGKKWAYGPGLSVAGRVIEVASGKPYEVFLSERIFQPLGMTDTTFSPTAEQVARLARLVQPTPDKSDITSGSHWLFELAPGFSPNPSGGLFSTASDMAKFCQMMLNGGVLNGKRILSAEAAKQMAIVQTGDQKTGIAEGTGWGLGFCVIREPQGVTDRLSTGTYGHAGAFGTQAWVDPGHETVLVLMIARQNFPQGLNVFGELQRLSVQAIRD